MAAKRWVRRRPAKVVKAQLRAARAEAADYAAGRRRMATSSPAMQDKYGRHFPPAEAAKHARQRSDYFQAKVMDRYADVYRDRMAHRRLRKAGSAWSLGKANVGRDKSTGRFVRRRVTR